VLLTWPYDPSEAFSGAPANLFSTASATRLSNELWGDVQRYEPLRKAMQMTTLLNRTYDSADELALIRSEPISIQWTKELRRSIGLHPGCKLLRGLLSLDLNTRTVVYPLLIKGWSSRQIANRLRVSLSTIHRLLEIGRQQLQSSLATPDPA
jgi:DNA-directed RNA polymerase specialized sigma subunit